MKSVLEQTYGNIEYIVIDGGSTDGSKEYIEEHSQSLAYWVSEPDKGIYNAMNKGIDQATGEYLLFLNSGDWLVDKDAIKEIKPEKFQNEVICCDILVLGRERDFLKGSSGRDVFFLFISGYVTPSINLYQKKPIRESRLL